MINTLFTSAGRRVELLRAFRNAYDDLRLPGKIIAADVDRLAPALHEADRRYLVPRLTDPAYIPTLRDICERERVGLVVPLIDPEISVLAGHREALEATGARVAVVPPDAARTTADKRLTYDFFRGLGIPTPRSWTAEALPADELAYPVFIKPRFGSAGQRAFRVDDRRALDFFLEYVPEPVVQEFLPGPEITTDVLCDFDGKVLSVVSRERIEVRSGEVAKGVTRYDAAIGEACVRIAEALRAVGPITVQCILRDGEPYFTEVNARFGGGVPLAIAAGARLPHWLLLAALGRSPDVPPLGSYRTGVYLTRFDDSYFLTEDRSSVP